jgi:hypothetical protein
MSEFESELQAAVADVSRARGDMVATVRGLAPADLDSARRGGWPTWRVLQHVIDSDYMYAAAVSAIKRTPAPTRPDAQCNGADPDVIAGWVDDTGKRLVESVHGIGEDDFYRLERLGHEEYSVCSILENAAAHYREHLGQIQAIIGAG